MMLRRIATLRQNQQGVAAIEFAVVLPLLLLIFLGTVTIFDLYRTSTLLDRATSTISDFVSRQTEVSETFMRDGVQLRLYALLDADAENLHYRVEGFRKRGDALVREWSFPADEGSLLRALSQKSEMPLVSDGDTLIVIRTALRHPTMFNTLGISDYTHHSMLAVRPRFTRAIISNW